MFKGRGLLVSYKALEDWSANQPGETVRMHGDDDNDEDEVETCQQIGTAGQSGEKQTSNEGVTGRGCLAVVYLSLLQHCCWYTVMAISSVAERIDKNPSGSKTWTKPLLGLT